MTTYDMLTIKEKFLAQLKNPLFKEFGEIHIYSNIHYDPCTDTCRSVFNNVNPDTAQNRNRVRKLCHKFYKDICPIESKSNYACVWLPAWVGVAITGKDPSNSYSVTYKLGED